MFLYHVYMSSMHHLSGKCRKLRGSKSVLVWKNHGFRTWAKHLSKRFPSCFLFSHLLSWAVTKLSSGTATVNEDCKEDFCVPPERTSASLLLSAEKIPPVCQPLLEDSEGNPCHFPHTRNLPLWELSSVPIPPSNSICLTVIARAWIQMGCVGDLSAINKCGY